MPAHWVGLLSTPFELLSGFLFGAFHGALINGIGKLLGSTLSFYIGQHCLKARVDKMAATNWRVRRVKGLLQGEPWRVAFLVRLAMIPIAVKNYGSAAAVRPYIHACRKISAGNCRLIKPVN